MRGHNFVAAFTDRDGNLIDVEKGAAPPTDLELELSERTILHYVTEDEEDKYFTVLGGFDETYDPVNAIMTKQRTAPKAYPKAYPGEL